MNDLSKKKQSSDSSAEKTYYNMNSFRGLKIDKKKPSNEIIINTNNYHNLTSRLLESNNYGKNTTTHKSYQMSHDKEKSRTISKNKIINNKIQANNTIEKNKTNKSILEISYNQKSSPKKLFAETSKKKDSNLNNLLQNTYANEIINTNPNYYTACLTDENEVRKSSKYDEKFSNEKFLVKYLIKHNRYIKILIIFLLKFKII